MTAAFYALATLMIVAAMLLVVRPLLRGRHESQQPRVVLMVALLLAIIVPALAIGTYVLIGAPAALNTATRLGFPASLPADTEQLRTRLEATPDDLLGWLNLGQAYEMLRQPEEASRAYARAIEVDADNPDALIAWVGAYSTLHPGQAMDSTAAGMLDKALARDPQNQRGLWLRGVGAFQANNFATAIEVWGRLLAQLEPGSPAAVDVQAQISLAEGRMTIATGTSPPIP